ncbi:cytidine deaminase [Candidatus Woesearchaeota archaeon]|nr:cytidine deaminase [Candidatus Woesearchaeota archaeon]
MDKKRPSKDDYYLDIARQVCKRSTCLRRRYGAVIVSKSDKIISTGYNGAIRNAIECIKIGKCMRNELKIPSGERYELCKAFHAEQNAIIASSPHERKGSTLYLYGEDYKGNPVNSDPCMMCRRTIVQGEISTVKARQSDGSLKILDVKDFVYAEDRGENFPENIRSSKEFKDYMKYFKKLNI